MEVINATYYNSGGNVYIYYGKLENGQYFSLSMNELFILDADFSETLTLDFIFETKGDTSEWDKQHIKERYSFPTDDSYILELGNKIFDKLEEKYPNHAWKALRRQELLSN